MTDRVPVPKKDLQRFHVQVPLPSRKRRGRKLVIRLARRERQSGRISPSLPLNPSPKRPNVSDVWRWWLLWLSILVILGGSVASGILWLTQLPPPINCQRISPLSADGDRLYCAQLAAESGKLDRIEAAMALVETWSNNHPLYSEAQRMIKQASGTILELAQQKMNQGDSSGAVKLASKIPVSSPLYSEARATIAAWQNQWTRGEEIVNRFKDALKVQQWYLASQLLLELPKLNSQYWTVSRVDRLIRQLEAEKQAWQQLEEARDLAQSNTLEQLQEAIALASKIDPNSYVKAQAKVEQSEWSRTLVQLATTRFWYQDYAGAVSILERIPMNTAHYQEAQDWIRLSRASEAAKQDTILALVDALETVREINAKSPIHRIASTQAAGWQLQLQDRTQLQVAQLLASSGQRTALEAAIERAQQVALGRPQRQRAQTLIAQWRKEIQHIEDRKMLAEAQQLAAGGAIEQLKSAVEIASKIQLGQPLRLDAQSAIAKWNRQIQALEDQPILDLARTFAQRRDLTAAISTLEQIRPGRALYAEAQKSIVNWVTQIQTAEDRPIVEAATALAAQGRFEAAIATISQIAPERALYEQAQTLKSVWTEQRATVGGQ